MPKKTFNPNQATISVSTTELMLKRMEYIQEYYGLKSRSAVIGMSINETYDRLLALGVERMKDSPIIK